MSVPNRRIRRRKADRSALQIAEEAFHLLRTVDLRYYWTFYLGAVPFGVLLLYFTADMSRSGLAEESIVGSSLLLAAAYFLMKICQGRFSLGLWETVSPPGGDRRERGWDRFRQTVALACFQAFQVPMLLVGLFFVIPLGWILAALQNASVLAYTRNSNPPSFRKLARESFRLSHRDWAQNHALLLLFGFVALFTWINLVATAITIPTFAKAFFGVESVFTISPNAAIFNSTFFLGTIILTHLVISPMLKAAYVLRCFYAESRATGDDLLSRLAACRVRRERDRPRSLDSVSSRAAAVGIGLILLGATTGSGEEAEPGPAGAPGADAAELAPQPLDQDALREEITETLEQKKYQWQLSRRYLDEEGGEEENWLTRRVREIADSARETMREFSEWLREALEKAERQEPTKARPSSGGDFAWFDEMSSTLSIGLIILVAGLVAWLVLLMYRKFRGAPSIEGEEVSAEAIDLQSEDIVASQLPENEWMRLAREQIEKGDRRLAIRALFLATLANLGEVGLLKIARFKTNRVYGDELLRRARKREQLRQAFAENIRLFERTWYGQHPVSEGMVDEFVGNYETIAGDSSRSSRAGSGEDATVPSGSPA